MLFRVEEPLRNPADYLARPDLKRTAIPDLVPDMAPCRGGGAAACKARFPYGLLMWAHGVVLLLSTAFIGWRLCKPDVRARLREPGAAGENLRRHLGLLALLASAILINAAVCGVISGPFARYEARLSGSGRWAR